MPSTNSLDSNILFVGHSLVNHDMPAILRAFMSQTGGNGTVQEHIINGSPLWWSWQNANRAELAGFGVNAKQELRLGQTDVLILTEGVPNPSFAEAVEGASNFYNLAISSNPNTKVYMYETWHDLRTGTEGFDVDYDPEDDIPWRERIDHALPQWQAIVDAVNDQRAPGAPEMQLIPVGQVMGRLYDEIAEGNVPGITDIRQLFVDDIHMNDIGNYLVAIVQYTTVFGRRPDDVALQQYGQWGEAFDAPSAALASFMKDIAWDEVMGDTGGGFPPDGFINDVFIGGEGNDIFDGGDGTDEVQLDGAWDEFEFSFDGALRITDTNTWSGVNEGVDTLIDIELLTFSDGTHADVIVSADNVIINFMTGTDVQMARLVFDTDNSRAWSSSTRTFDSDGVTQTGRTTTYDDGRILEVEFDDAGNRVSQTMTDTADAYVWNERVTTFNADGTIKTGRIITFDNGRIREVEFDEAGNRSLQTTTDAADVYGWESRTQEFDEKGNVIDTYYVDDILLF
ncbi:hypothetical protein AB9K34_07860 [Sedimentitalea sp. XS_ASV28]|uniref:hypothetical protein n=1 Tax=Sedimentitalea sp. XS_ASV28 TaxID=3241296 RepID=UPI0035147C6D